MSNPGQENSDGDPTGDACDPDDDNDGIGDGQDSCATTHNPGQGDIDHDGIGDACDGSDNRECPEVAPTGPVSRPVYGVGGSLGPAAGAIRNLSCTIGGLGL